MSVYKHPTIPGYQMIKISHGRKGKAEYISFNGSREEALRLEKEIRGLTDLSDPHFGDHIPEFMVAYKNKSSPNSVQSINYSFKHLSSFFGSFKLRHIKPSLVEQYKAKRLGDGVKKRTITVELSALSAYFQWINDNKGTEFEKPKLFTKRETKPPLPQVLTIEEMAALFNHLSGDVRLIVELMGLCGLRRNEALNLTANDIDLKGRTVRVYGKGGKWRICPIALEGMLTKLDELCKQRPAGPLFPSPHDQSQPRKDIRKAIRTAAKDAGISKDVRPHLFRHSFGAALVNNGTDIRIIQDLLGHSELTTTMIYTQVANNSKRSAVQNLATLIKTGC